MFSEISSMTIDSLTFIEKSEREKQKQILKSELIKDIIAEYIGYFKSNNSFYTSIKTRRITQLYI